MPVVVLMNTVWPRISRQTESNRNALEEVQPSEVLEVAIPMRGEA